MGKVQKEWAKRKRAELMAELGPVCVECGEDRVFKLCFDCIEPRGDYHHRGEASTRMSFYRREHAAGNIQVLCVKCNGRKGQKEKQLCPF